MTLLHYRLRGHEVEVVYSWYEWGQWFEKADRQVAETMLEGDIRVSTVFLGLDHRFGDPGPPLVFETMVFGPPEEMSIFGRIKVLRPELSFDGAFDRYATWDEAEAGHKRIVELVEREIDAAQEMAANALSSIRTTPLDKG